jgi:hypothetical protein
MQDGFNTGDPVKDFLLQLEYATRRGFKELPFFRCHTLIGTNNRVCSERLHKYNQSGGRLYLHESGTFVKFTKAGAELFA